MQAIMSSEKDELPPHIPKWLRHGEESLKRLKEGLTLDSSLAPHNQLSQINVLVQMEHISSYPEVKKRVKAGTLQVHGFWFDIEKADVYTYSNAQNRFMVIDEAEGNKLIKCIER